jgi:hypothetical protein
VTPHSRPNGRTDAGATRSRPGQRAGPHGFKSSKAGPDGSGPARVTAKSRKADPATRTKDRRRALNRAREPPQYPGPGRLSSGAVPAQAKIPARTRAVRQDKDLPLIPPAEAGEEGGRW